MNVRRELARAANFFLKAGSLKLAKLDSDFDNLPVDQFTIDCICEDLFNAFLRWKLNTLVLNDAQGVLETGDVKYFYQSWRESCFSASSGGSRLNNLFWLYALAKVYQPDLVVDSGTYQGASAWALHLGCPSAKTYSFDIEHNQLLHQEVGVEYINSDWLSHEFERRSSGRALVYFDDHVDQIKRLIEARDLGFDVAIFDDDFPVTSYYRMAPSSAVLPKIEFALDPKLTDVLELQWDSGGERHTWRVDHAYLDEGRACIAATERLPDTSMITGIQQTPYRLVRLASKGCLG